jgi:hypothetical protein
MGLDRVARGPQTVRPPQDMHQESVGQASRGIYDILVTNVGIVRKASRGKQDARRVGRCPRSACSQQTASAGTGTHPQAPSPAAPATVPARLACEGALAARQGLGDHAGRASCHPVTEPGLTCCCPGWRVARPTLSLGVRQASACALCARLQPLSQACDRRRRLHVVPSPSHFLPSW